MNIDDIEKESISIPAGGLFAAMFKHQHELALKYVAIEARNGFWHPGENFPHIDDPKLQHFLKDMFWRTTEELAEAMEVVMSVGPDWKEDWDRSSDVRHYFEEVADAIHFLIEASIYSRVTPNLIDASWKRAVESRSEGWCDSDLPLYVHTIIMRLGLAANCLKNKPWKETQMPTDENLFKLKLWAAWDAMCGFLIRLGLELDDVYVLYMRKNQVNQFRQRTKY